MKQKKVWLMCGIPASGKSTWCAKAKQKPGTVHISRDVIRFSKLKEGEDYFAHENEVYRDFITQINEAIWNNDVTDILVDATHLTENSRNKLLRNLDLKDVSLNAVNFIIDLNLAWDRNSKRKGRECVPFGTMKSMFNSYRPTGTKEKYHYNTIIDITTKQKGDDSTYDICDFRFTSVS